MFVRLNSCSKVPIDWKWAPCSIHCPKTPLHQFLWYWQIQINHVCLLWHIRSSCMSNFNKDQKFMQLTNTRYQTKIWQMVNHIKCHLKFKLALQSNSPWNLEHNNEENTQFHDGNRPNRKKAARYQYHDRHRSTISAGDHPRIIGGAVDSTCQGDPIHVDP